MRTLHLTGLALAIAAGFALPLAGSAEAAMGGALPSTQVLPIENAQFFFLGHNFCWYDGGWQGPGWYWCGYAWNNGYGWGGGDGWHGWSRSQWSGNHRPNGAPPPRPVGHAPLVHSAAPNIGGHGPAPSHSGGGVWQNK
jgi:hypothetical protein